MTKRPVRIVIERMKDDNRLRLTVEGGVLIEAIEVEGETTQGCWVFVDPETVNYLFNQHQKETI